LEIKVQNGPIIIIALICVSSRKLDEQSTSEFYIVYGSAYIKETLMHGLGFHQSSSYIAPFRLASHKYTQLSCMQKAEWGFMYIKQTHK